MRVAPDAVVVDSSIAAARCFDEEGSGEAEVAVARLSSETGTAPGLNWHHSAVTNGSAEGLNNLIKRIKRAAFGFRNFANYRIRALLYAGKPDWKLLEAIRPG